MARKPRRTDLPRARIPSKVTWDDEALNSPGAWLPEDEPSLEPTSYKAVRQTGEFGSRQDEMVKILERVLSGGGLLVARDATHYADRQDETVRRLEAELKKGKP